MGRGAAGNIEAREAARGRIVEAAIRLFGDRGFDATTVADIARAAGVAQGLLYHYFDSKDALVRAVFAESMSEVRRSWALAPATGTPAERLEGMIRGAFVVQRERLDFWRFTYGARMQRGVVAALGDELARWTGEIVQTFAAIFAEAGIKQPEVEAALLFAAVDGVAQHYALDPEHYPIHAVVDALARKYRALTLRPLHHVIHHGV